MVELPADSGEAKVTNKANKPADTFDKYFANGEESRRSTSELSTWMDSVLLKEVTPPNLIVYLLSCNVKLEPYIVMIEPILPVGSQSVTLERSI